MGRPSPTQTLHGSYLRLDVVVERREEAAPLDGQVLCVRSVHLQLTRLDERVVQDNSQLKPRAAEVHLRDDTVCGQGGGIQPIIFECFNVFFFAVVGIVVVVSRLCSPRRCKDKIQVSSATMQVADVPPLRGHGNGAWQTTATRKLYGVPVADRPTNSGWPMGLKNRGARKRLKVHVACILTPG